MSGDQEAMRDAVMLVTALIHDNSTLAVELAEHMAERDPEGVIVWLGLITSAAVEALAHTQGTESVDMLDVLAHQLEQLSVFDD